MRHDSTLDGGRGFYLGRPFSDSSGSGSARHSLLDGLISRPARAIAHIPRQVLIGILLVVALLAFEIFNFDTTQYALGDFLGQVSFIQVRWATILAVAFCAIDFAGLAYLFGAEQGNEPHHEIWYLMGAWLLGATMNALMTWWAVSVILLGNDFGNELMSREELLHIVPIFVAVLVWLTRILFIGAFSVAGNHLFGSTDDARRINPQAPANITKRQPPQPVNRRPAPMTAMSARSRKR